MKLLGVSSERKSFSLPVSSWWCSSLFEIFELFITWTQLWVYTYTLVEGWKQPSAYSNTHLNTVRVGDSWLVYHWKILLVINWSERHMSIYFLFCFHCSSSFSLILTCSPWAQSHISLISLSLSLLSISLILVPLPLFGLFCSGFFSLPHKILLLAWDIDLFSNVRHSNAKQMYL